jgi:hypothetical protein
MGKTMISMEQYLMGRDVLYPDEYTEEIKFNATQTLLAINPLVTDFYNDTGISLVVASGWRPAEVNAATSNSAGNSWHIHAGACDLRDTQDRDFARYVAANQDKLVTYGLYVERFEWTPSWVHLSQHAPKSGKRFYIPSSAPAKCDRLPEQDEFNC